VTVPAPAYLICLADGARVLADETRDGRCPTCGGDLVAETVVRGALGEGGSTPPTAGDSTAPRAFTQTQESAFPYDIAEAARDPANHFGRYVRARVLGKGGFGTVWLAWDATLRRRVALKILSGDEPQVIERFKREARLAARLSHPNIAAVHDVGEHEGLPYFAMDFVEGASLDTLLHGGKLAIERGVKLLVDVARGLQYAHEHGVVHRDVKPQNILVGTDGVARVADFGLARDLKHTTLTESGDIIGTPLYMAPEQIRGDTREIRQDRGELRQDREALREALKSGDKDAIRKARKELRADRRELREDRKDRRDDSRDLRHDRRELRHDLRHKRSGK
jgi:predicted Ser/Thr protein kinase